MVLCYCLSLKKLKQKFITMYWKLLFFIILVSYNKLSYTNIVFNYNYFKNYRLPMFGKIQENDRLILSTLNKLHDRAKTS